MSLANDKVSLVQRAIGANALVASRVVRDGFTNVIQSDTYKFASGNRGENVVFYGETAPGANYDSYVKVGDKYVMLTFSSGVITAVTEYIYSEFGWVKAIMGGDSLSTNTTSTANKELARIWGSSSATSGIFRGLSVRTELKGNSTGTGDAIRAYNLATLAVPNMHGIHATAQVGDETTGITGSISGQAAGVRATIGCGPSMVTVGGTLASLRCDSYFQTAVTSAATSYIYAGDVGTYGVDSFLRIGTVVQRSTDKTNPGAYTYVSGHMTHGNIDGALKVVTPDGTFYIPLVVSFS